jgi:uncharacterized membrane protein YeaQ/YmgE (transglycosylase-associated protein family)
MNIILWLVFGAIAGWLASVITGRGHGLLGDIVVGILGAFLGGWLSTSLGGPAVSGFNLVSFIVAVLGAIVLLVIVSLVRRDRDVIR